MRPAPSHQVYDLRPAEDGLRRRHRDRVRAVSGAVPAIQGLHGAGEGTGDLKPVGVVFLVREEKNSTNLISLGREINGVSNEHDVYQKLSYQVPESQKGDRLIVVAGLSESVIPRHRTRV